MNINISLPVATFILLLFALSATAQDKDYIMKANSKEVEANFMTSYYDQNGNNAAVTGGRGTEQLSDIASSISVNVPLDSANSLAISLGADFYSSASTDNIDPFVSSESSSDVRFYGNGTYTRKNLKKHETYALGAGASAEYDYQSLSVNASFAKEWQRGNSELSINTQAFFDTWDAIFPYEMRGQVSLPTENRQSYNLQINFAQVITKRFQASISSEMVYMNGLLSTPFHRVYFKNNTGSDIERLPAKRLKLPLGVRANYFFGDFLVARTYYRYYTDDWGINAHTASIEVPVKIWRSFTIAPFYRYHSQSASDQFAGYAQHEARQTFYTSDYDLSQFQSHKYGLGLRYRPLYGLARIKWGVKKARQIFVIKSMSFRGGVYERSNGLNASFITLNLSMTYR